MTNESAVSEDQLTISAPRSLRLLDGVRPLYILPTDPLVEEVLIPGFRAAGKVDCMVGFFSSEVLASLAPGLATYVAASKNSFRLIVSPLLRAEDQEAIEEGLKSAEEIADGILEDLIVTEDLLQHYTLKCLVAAGEAYRNQGSTDERRPFSSESLALREVRRCRGGTRVG